MRKLLLSLMVLASLVSCGKDKSSSGVSSSSSAVTLADSTATDLGTKIANSESYFQAAPAAYYRYAYTVTTVTSAGQNCEEKEGWFGIKYTVCKASNSNSNATYKYVAVSSVDLATKRSELASIINSSYAGGVVNYGSYYQVTTTVGTVYIIDPRAPIQANPVLVRPLSTGSITSYIGVVQ